MNLDLNLTPSEAKLLVHALCAVTKSGGGSMAFHLSRKLGDMLGVEIDPDYVVALQHNAANELNEA